MYFFGKLLRTKVRIWHAVVSGTAQVDVQKITIEVHVVRHKNSVRAQKIQIGLNDGLKRFGLFHHVRGDAVDLRGLQRQINARIHQRIPFIDHFPVQHFHGGNFNNTVKTGRKPACFQIDNHKRS